MSKVFYDHWIVLDDLEIHIKEVAETAEEREELWRIVDEIVHSRILTSLLDNLKEENHEEFLGKFHEAPHDEALVSYLEEKIEGRVEEIIKEEVDKLRQELLDEI